jgi:hypothetical protein
MLEITVPTSALVKLFDYLPNPDDPDPVGPAGPVIRGLDWVLLNPQPLPPREVLVPRLVRHLGAEWGPRPEPWVWASTTRAVITAHLDRFTMAGIIIVSGDTEHPVQVITKSLSTVVDELCGTPPHKGPFPALWGPLLDTGTLHPVNLVIAGIQFQKAADALQDHPLHDALDQAAERLLGEGFNRLGSPGGQTT